jgi:hypothetical protein
MEPQAGQRPGRMFPSRQVASTASGSLLGDATLVEWQVQADDEAAQFA